MKRAWRAGYILGNTAKESRHDTHAPASVFDRPFVGGTSRGAVPIETPGIEVERIGRHGGGPFGGTDAGGRRGGRRRSPGRPGGLDPHGRPKNVRRGVSEGQRGHSEGIDRA